MHFKRNEAYRYTFASPITGQLTVNNGRMDVDVLDISHEGARLYCRHAVSLHNKTAISLSFQLNDTPFWAEGHIAWIKTYPHSADLGVILNSDDAYKQSMTQELKKIARQEK
ncbi:hypothetical protein GCM10028778_02010 [Barrientosiimonas marina]|uniref:PilZ domain-containing protein n=1 Tax=Lentibacillus kimchii TaxID=1542911 RepID=A0ABW2USN2_9BACI